jgi:hypothetical protein
MALSPFSCDIMGWRGAGGNGAASTGSYYWMGGLLMILGGIGEWILGNTFPFLVFCAYGTRTTPPPPPAHLRAEATPPS